MKGEMMKTNETKDLEEENTSERLRMNRIEQQVCTADSLLDW